MKKQKTTPRYSLALCLSYGYKTRFTLFKGQPTDNFMKDFRSLVDLLAFADRHVNRRRCCWESMHVMCSKNYETKTLFYTRLPQR